MGLLSRSKTGEKKSVDNSRYDGKPMNILFDNFVLDTIEGLPKEKIDQLNSLNLASIFKTEQKDWKLIVKQVLNLSDTIEIAILDLWYKNRTIADKQGTEYSVGQFAMDFVDNFYKDDSKVDVWTEESLAQAKERIQKNRATEK